MPQYSTFSFLDDLKNSIFYSQKKLFASSKILRRAKPPCR